MSTYSDASLILPVAPERKAKVGAVDGKIYCLKPTDGTGDFDVVRNCTATEINSDLKIEDVAIGMPRFNFDTLGGCPSLLTEPASTNLITYPISFDNVYWTKSGATIDNNGGAGYSSPHVNYPTSAFKLVESAVTSDHSTYSTFAVLTSNKYTFSAFIKKGERYKVALADRNTGAYASFNLDDGTLIEQLSMTSTIESLSNDWYKLSITTTSAVTVLVPQIFVLDDSYTTGLPISSTYLGDGTSGVYIFGAQVEQQSYATSFIYDGTEGSTTTRLADAVSKTGITSIIGQTEGSFYIDCVINSDSNATTSIINTTNSVVDSISVGKNNSTEIMTFAIYANSVLAFQISTTTTYAVGDRLKILAIYKSGDSRLFVNGIKEVSSSVTFTFSAPVDGLIVNDSVVYFGYQQINNCSSVEIRDDADYTDAQAITKTTL